MHTFFPVNAELTADDKASLIPAATLRILLLSVLVYGIFLGSVGRAIQFYLSEFGTTATVVGGTFVVFFICFLGVIAWIFSSQKSHPKTHPMKVLKGLSYDCEVVIPGVFDSSIRRALTLGSRLLTLSVATSMVLEPGWKGIPTAAAVAIVSAWFLLSLSVRRHLTPRSRATLGGEASTFLFALVAILGTAFVPIIGLLCAYGVISYCEGTPAQSHVGFSFFAKWPNQTRRLLLFAILICTLSILFGIATDSVEIAKEIGIRMGAPDREVEAIILQIRIMEHFSIPMFAMAGTVMTWNLLSRLSAMSIRPKPVRDRGHLGVKPD